MKSPSPHYPVQDIPKAIILGCDPTALGKDNNILEFKTVFDIGGDKRYFSNILINLKEINLTLDDIFVQNLIHDYKSLESSKDKNWISSAQEYIPMRKAELNKLDSTKKYLYF